MTSAKIKSRQMIFSKRALPVFVGGAAALVLLSCRAGRNFYVLEEIRVPAMQSLQKLDSPEEGQHCFDLGNERVCQQYPLRPAQKTILRFLAIAPATPQPLTLRISKLQRAKLPQLLNQNSDCNTILEAAAKVRNNDIALSALGLQDVQWSRQVRQESPMRVEEHTLTFNTPTADLLLSEALSEGWLPLYTLEYEASVQDGSFRKDRGVFTFTIVTAPQAGGGGSGAPQTDSARCLAQAFSGSGGATTNTPPVIQAISPTQGSKVAGSPVELSLSLSAADPDAGARRRAQWYLSRGELENQADASTKLSFSGSEPLTAVGVVRDLQGGLDFAWTTFSPN